MLNSTLEIGTMEITQKLPITVIFHGPGCLDGFASAYIAWKYFNEHEEPVEFIACQYDQPLPEEEKFLDREVYILDFSFPLEQMQSILERAKRVTILDHHKSAQELYSKKAVWDSINFEFRFDMDKSGCRMTWEYFYPDVEVPTFVKYIEDRDLWKWQYGEETKHYCRGIASTIDMTSDFYESEFEIFDNDSTEQAVHAIKMNGAAIDNYYQTELRKVLTTSCMILTRFGECAILNANYLFASEAGNILAKIHPYAIIWQFNGEKVKASVRSDKNNPNHVPAIDVAKFYGGGGHEHAAGFSMDIKEFFNRFLHPVHKEKEGK